ncbi:MAG: Gfo/Idh/MocA family oxidoreductase [Pyrinomonadaceae bacterium]|nr:Gfo/Idh/MocA family oxidoreductase [Pyrinomonadaceae bacterium]
MTIKLGVIGCGYWGPNLIRNFAENEKAEVAWLCDLDEKRLAGFKRRYPTVKTSTNFQDLIDDDNLDAIVIATPVSTHYKFAKAALESGKHIFVEKPFTDSISNAEELVQIADSKGLNIFVDHIFLYTGAVRKIKTLIDSGELGDLLYFDSTRVNLGLFQKDINVVWDLAPHDFSIMDYLIGREPKQISAIGSSHINPNIENVAYVVCKFDDEFIAHYHFNWLSPVKIRQTLIAGTKKMIIFDDNEPSEKLKIYDKGVTATQIENESDRESAYQTLVSYRTGDVWIPKIDGTEALKSACNEFLISIIEKRKPMTDGEAGLRVVKLLESAQVSIKNNGNFVKI